MAFRNPRPLQIKRFRGLNSFAKKEDIAPDWWTDSMNVMVSAKGSAEVLRSPRGINVALSTGNPVMAFADYSSTQTHKLLFDIKVPQDESDDDSDGVLTMNTYTISDDLTNLLVREDQKVYPFVSIVVNGKLYRVNQHEMIQFIENAVTHYRVGIDAPAAAPTIAYTGSDADTASSLASDSDDDAIQSGIQFSYAYYNSATQDCSRPSPLSNRLGPGEDVVSFAVVASTEPGVDKIVFFATLDGGDIPYLLVDASGDLNTRNNTSATVTFNVVDLFYDTLTPEPVYNFPPPLGAQFMFSWKDRVFLCDFIPGSAVNRSVAAYSGFESVYIGQPGSSWPSLNQIGIPNKGEVLKGGIGTEIGALFLSDLDAYLLSGYPPDKTQGPEATTTVTEHMEPKHWNIGTRSAKTLKSTPFGTIWLDQAARLRKWNGEAIPTEIGIPLRKELDKLDPALFDKVEGAWYQMGRQGGYYVLAGPMKHSAGQRVFLVGLYEDPETGEKNVGYGISDVQAYVLAPVRIFNDIRMVYGGIDRTYEFLNSDWAGDGWPNGTQIFFEHTLNNDGNFGYFHSLRFDIGGNDLPVVTVRDIRQDGTPEDMADAREISVDTDTDTGGAFFGLIDEYGRRKVIRFTFNLNDGTVIDGVSSEPESDPKEVKNLQVVFKNTKRVI